jgi:hypothetical protein
MKEALSLFTLIIGAFCFVVFLTVFKPDAISAVPGRSKPGLRIAAEAELGDDYGVHSIHSSRNSRMSLLRALCRTRAL